MKPNIDFQKFIGSFDQFIQQVQQLDKADNPKLVFKESNTMDKRSTFINQENFTICYTISAKNQCW